MGYTCYSWWAAKINKLLDQFLYCLWYYTSNICCESHAKSASFRSLQGNSSTDHFWSLFSALDQIRTLQALKVLILGSYDLLLDRPLFEHFLKLEKHLICREYFKNWENILEIWIKELKNLTLFFAWRAVCIELISYSTFNSF